METGSPAQASPAGQELTPEACSGDPAGGGDLHLAPCCQLL